MVEAALHELLFKLPFPSNRLFAKVGAGGLNEKTWTRGESFCVSALVVPGGVPAHWTRKAPAM